MCAAGFASQGDGNRLLWGFGEAWFPPIGENPLEFLREQPQFQNMRQVIQQNPALLPALLQQLGQENPQLLQVPLNPSFPSPSSVTAPF